MFTRTEADNILNQINEANLNDIEFVSIDTSKEVFDELAKILHTRGGVDNSFEKLKLLALENGVVINDTPFNQVFVGAVIE